MKTILLLQARAQEDASLLEERQTFAQAADVPLSSIFPFDLLSGIPTLAMVQQSDAMMIGGSADYYVSKKNLPNFERVLQFLRDVVAEGHPTFASCFGFQLMVQALGGDVIHDPAATEVGTFAITLTRQGNKDELFQYLPQTFPAQLGRKDRAAVFPTDVVHLATSERAPFQALRVPGKPIWATQFHPELTRSLNLGRFQRYVASYASDQNAAAIQRMMDAFAESPAASELIYRFMQLI